VIVYWSGRKIKRYQTLRFSDSSLPIVTLSLNEDMLREIDRLQKRMGFSGRSEIMRAGIRKLLAEERMEQDFVGIVSSLLLAIHDEDSDDEVSSIRHAFDKIINVHLHNKIDKNRCLEIFLLKGDSKEIKEIARGLQANKKMHLVKLMVI
jgi:CopG family transcriptional regulator, nickel-responsive regulator